MRLVKVGLVLAVCFVVVSSIPELTERKGKGKKPGKKPVKPAPGGKGSGGKGPGEPSPGGKGSGGPSPGGKGSGGKGTGGKGTGSGMGLPTDWSGVWEMLGQLKALLLQLEAGGGEPPIGSGSGEPPVGSGSGSGAEALKQEGESCGSCMCPPTFTAGTCEDGLTCVHNPLIADLPGTCTSGNSTDLCSDKECGDVCDTSNGMLMVMRYCQPDGSCGSNAAPECHVCGDICPMVVEPVCGADGKTYSNNCKACGVEILCNGECPCEGAGSGSGVTGSGHVAPGAEFHSPDDEYHTTMMDAASSLTPETCMTGASGCTGNCVNDPASSYYSEIHYDNARVIMANGIPYHSYENDAAQANPNQACEHRIILSLPITPTKGTFQESNTGPVGISVSGGFIFNHLSNPNGDLAVPNEGISLDSCHGHSEPTCRYHYHDINLDGTCTHEVENEADVTLADATCHVVGWMLDGFPLYVCKDAGGASPLKSCYVGSGDNANGYTFTPSEACHLDEASGYKFPEGYGYLVTDTYPWVPMGYMGSEVRDICYLDGSAGGAAGGKGGKGGKGGSGMPPPKGSGSGMPPPKGSGKTPPKGGKKPGKGGKGGKKPGKGKGR